MAEAKFCSGCRRTGEDIVADDWCTGCSELVCKICAKVHQKFAPPHEIVPVNDIPYMGKFIGAFGNNCEVHQKKFVKFCHRHDTVLCDQCVTELHFNCKSVVPIEMAAKLFQTSTLIQDLKNRMTRLEEISAVVIKRKVENKHLLSRQKEDILQMVSTLRHQINNHLDKIEKDFSTEVEARFVGCIGPLEEKRQDLIRRSDEMKTWLEHLKVLETSFDSVALFKVVKALDLKLKKHEAKFGDIKKENKLDVVRFQPHKNIFKMPTLIPIMGTLIQTEKADKEGQSVGASPPPSPGGNKSLDEQTIGKSWKIHGKQIRSSSEGEEGKLNGMKESPSVPSLQTMRMVFSKNREAETFDKGKANERFILQKPVNGKKLGSLGELSKIEQNGTNDQCLPFPGSKKCKISLISKFDSSDLGNNVVFGKGCFIADDKVMLPHYNDTFLYVCSFEGDVRERMKLDYEPWDVATIDSYTAIITLKKKGFQLLDLRTKKLSKNTKPGGSGCWAMCATKKGIWVERNDNSVHMIDVQGNILRKMTTPHKIWDFTVSETGDILYVTSLYSSVFELKSDGTHNVFYSSSDLREPSSITRDDRGFVYVAGRGSDNIHRISADGGNYEIFLKRHDGIVRPSGIFLNYDNKKMMVINNCNKTVLLYNAQ